MNRILIEICTENNAFRNGTNGEGFELARILFDLSEDIRNNGARDRLLKDINGNFVGEVMTDHTPVFT